MNMKTERKRELRLVDQVDALNEEVKVLALNLAVYLAKAKGSSEQIHRLEPEFIRLVNGTVKVVQQLALIINAARNREKSSRDMSSSSIHADQIEIRLKSILDQCAKIMHSLSQTGNFDLQT